MGRHSGKEYMACREGIHGSRCGGTMYAQATLQSRCRRDTCGWNLAGLLGSEMSTPVSLAQSPRSQHPPIACGEPPQAFCCTAELCARRAGCSPNAGEMGMCLILLSAPSSVERSKAFVLTFSWRHPLHPPGWELTLHSGGWENEVPLALKPFTSFFATFKILLIFLCSRGEEPCSMKLLGCFPWPCMQFKVSHLWTEELQLGL